MADRVVLMAVDGLDWRRLRSGAKAGRLPVFAKLLEQCAYSEIGVKACVPGMPSISEEMLSPVLWTTVASGQHYFQHGVYDFRNGMVSGANPPLFESRHVRSPRLWDILTEYNMSSLVVGYYVTHPAYAIQGTMVSDLFGEVESTDVTWPPERCDEFARKLGAPDYAGYVRMARRLMPDPGAAEDDSRRAAGESGADAARETLRKFSDLSPAEIDALLAASVEDLRKTPLEHRLLYPVARDARFHRLFMELLDAEPWRFATIYYRLIDFTSHGFWEDGATLPEDYRKNYGQVVNRAYEWIDERVGEVLSRLDEGDKLLILSDHGFEANAGRGSTREDDVTPEFTTGRHAEPAVLLAWGGPSKARFEQVSLLDIGPTILDYLGIPQANSLDGGPIPGLLVEAIRNDLPPIEAYAPPATAGAAVMSREEEAVVLERLKSLGYLE